MGLTKLKLFPKSLGQDWKITYINFNHKSNLHFLIQKILKEYVRMSPRKNLGQEVKIFYISFSCKSNLQFLMETNMKEYVRLLPRKIIPKGFLKNQFGAWHSLVFTSWVGESHISFSWQSPNDGVSVTILVSITRLSWHQEENLIITFCLILPHFNWRNDKKFW